ncbi:Flp family type IVb pilin [Pseudonocardia bannensis]|uniref:Flp family type IVb pilin n=1 Tax=Pseudonocardia bannensis TaxID=630973 RepID=A0A848DNI6_9PSEU|nr:Flp family type IVb pilin [Pseudonocardia bannensis]NMH94093.1 Flp family type IVb pilin [Pseudonocardia bannensis]
MLLLLTLVQNAQARLRSEDRGATAVEYGLLIAGIAALVMAAVFLLGPAIANLFTEVTDQIG